MEEETLATLTDVKQEPDDEAKAEPDDEVKDEVKEEVKEEVKGVKDVKDVKEEAMQRSDIVTPDEEVNQFYLPKGALPQQATKEEVNDVAMEGGEKDAATEGGAKEAVEEAMAQSQDIHGRQYIYTIAREL